MTAPPAPEPTKEEPAKEAEETVAKVSEAAVALEPEPKAPAKVETKQVVEEAKVLYHIISSLFFPWTNESFYTNTSLCSFYYYKHESDTKLRGGYYTTSSYQIIKEPSNSHARHALHVILIKWFEEYQ